MDQMEIVSAMDFASSISESSRIVDLRSASDFSIRRLAVERGAVLVNLPLESLLCGDRSSELPPRDVKLDLLVSPLQDLEDVRGLFLAKVSKATGASRTPWKVGRVAIATDDFFGCLPPRSVASGPPSLKPPFPRLWRPDSMVESVLLPLLKGAFSSGGAGNVVDLGSGAGRDVAFLAENLLSSKGGGGDDQDRWKVFGIDNHKGARRRSDRLWQNRGVSECAELVGVNLKKLADFEAFRNDRGPLKFLYCVRYLNRPLLLHLSESITLPASIVALSHFTVEADGTFPYDHPKLSDVVKLGEMEGIFKDDAWEVLHNDRVRDSDAGRLLINFVARRRHCNT